MASIVYTFKEGSNPHAPLVLFVHGRAGNVGVMVGFSRYIPEGCAQLFVQAPISDPIGGFSWWLVENPAADPWRASFALDEILASVLPSLRISPRFIVGLGFSQGGAVLSMALQRNPRLLKGLGLLASFVVRSPDPVVEDGHPQIFFAHGEHDTVVTLAEAERGRAYLDELGWPTMMVVDPVGHKVGIAGMRALREWLGQVMAG